MSGGITTTVDCPSLEGTDLTLSTTNVTEGTIVRLSCDDFGHQPSGDTDVLICLNTGNWSRRIPECEWSWDFTTHEKLVFGTSVAAVSFIIVVVIAIFIAYFCCYKKRRDRDENINDTKYDGYANTGTLDKPWLGYIPRPKVTEGRFYN